MYACTTTKYASTSNLPLGTGIACVDGLPGASYVSNDFPDEFTRNPANKFDLITLGGPIASVTLHAPGQGADDEMDEFTLFRRVLDATEIGALMAEHDFRDRNQLPVRQPAARHSRAHLRRRQKRQR
jgi:hypothetical protein